MIKKLDNQLVGVFRMKNYINLYSCILCFTTYLLILSPTKGYAQNFSDADVLATQSLLLRILPDHSESFTFEIIPKENGLDLFEIESKDECIIIRGNNGVSMAAGLNWYLKYYCSCDVSLFGTQLDLPKPLPTLVTPVRHVNQQKYRYMLNYCSFGYTMVWWDWPQWERLIDWMALSGINTPLAITGQEAVWRNVAKKIGITNLTDFLAGPPYLPFGWMGTLDGWGGPLPENWIDAHLLLQKKILARERELGMTPVLQGFTGHIPSAIVAKYNDSQTQKIEWHEWETYLLDPLDPLFQKIATIFMQEQTKLFGTDHYYAADSFIEMTPPSGETKYLQDLSQAILIGMTTFDPEAVWVLQGWAFYDKHEFWTPKRLESFLETIPNENILILDLFCEQVEVWKLTNAFYNKPWLWCNIQTFGANTQMHGPLKQINQKLNAAKVDPKRGQLSGIGFVNEGFEGNPVVYEFLTELPWHAKSIKVDTWINSYAKSRYSKDNEHTQKAWELLVQSVYSDSTNYTAFMSAVRYPRINFTSGFPYEVNVLVQAWEQLLLAANEFKTIDTYSYDLTSVGIQVLACTSQIQHVELVKAFKTKNVKKLKQVTEKLLQTIKDMEKLAATRREFLLGRWLEDAKRWGTTYDESALYEWNARRVLTLWGETATLRDYSRRMWSGMLSDFYLPRWEMFTEALINSLGNNMPFDEELVNKKLIDWELSWANQKKIYLTTTKGDFLNISREMWKKYGLDD